MNKDNIMAGAEQMAGDGGYSEGTREAYEAFVKVRNQSLRMNVMNEHIEHCLYQAGLTAQGCWDELDDYAKQGIEKFAELLILEAYDFVCSNPHRGTSLTGKQLKEHFGVK